MKPRSHKLPLLSAALLAALAGSCATQPAADQASVAQSSEAASAQPRALGPKRAALAKAAEAQKTSPHITDRPPPPFLNTADLSPFTEPADDISSTRRMPLDAALAKLSSAPPSAQAKPAEAPPQDDAKRQALRLYTSGRMKLLRGDSSGAILDFESATRLDPTASAPWRELAEAQMAQGKRLAAISSLQQAVQRGLTDPRSLWMLGRDSLRSGKSQQAAEYLAKAANSRPDQADPALQYLLYTDLGEALERLGYSRAAADAYSRGLSFPDQFSSSTRLRLEFADLYRRRGDLWLKAGDLDTRLGRYDNAAHAYAESAAYAASDPDEAIVRQVYALEKAGQPAAAALALLNRIELQRGNAGQKMLELVRYLAAESDSSTLLRGAVFELADSLNAEAPPTAQADLALLRAAAAKPPESLDILRAHLAKYPSHTNVLVTALELARAQSPGADLVELLRLVKQSPAYAGNFTSAALGAGIDADAAIASLTSHADSDAEALLLSHILGQIGRNADAWTLVSSHKWSPAFAGAGELSRCFAAAITGRWAESQAAFDAIVALPPTTPNRDQLIIAAAGAMQRPELALRYAPAPAATDSLDILLDTAQFSLLTGDAKGAEARLMRALDIDPFDERPYAVLLNMYGSDGPLADQSALGETARDLRQAIPSSRTLRSVFAREMIQRAPDAQAEQMLLSLAEEDISDSDNGRTLVAVWERLWGGAPAQGAGPNAKAPPRDAAQLKRAETWLRSKIETHAEIPWLRTGLARTLIAQGRTDEALQLLADRYAKRPIPEFAMLRESILRDQLGRVEEADQLTLARVQASPRSIDASIDFADLLVRQKKPSEALATLESGLPSGIVFADHQSYRLTMLMIRSAQAIDAAKGAAEPAWAQLFEVAAGRAGTRLTPQLHDTRIRLLARTPGITPEQVRAAAEAASRQYPALASNFYYSAGITYAVGTDPRTALPFFIAAINASNSPPSDLLRDTMRLCVVSGTAEDARSLVNSVTDPAKVAAVLRAFVSDDTIPTDPVALRAELAYIFGNFFGSQGKNADANACYRLALEIFPDHAWSLNNLGYAILEKGGDITEAARMLDRALVLLPAEGNVQDSVGWLRYKQGIFEDQDSPQGKVEGAVTLLRRAAESSKGAGNATVFSHLGDALWAANRRDDAAKAWEKAESLASAELETIKAARAPSTLALQTATKELDAIRARRKAVQENTEPPIEPRHAAAPK